MFEGVVREKLFQNRFQPENVFIFFPAGHQRDLSEAIDEISIRVKLHHLQFGDQSSFRFLVRPGPSSCFLFPDQRR